MKRKTLWGALYLTIIIGAAWLVLDVRSAYAQGGGGLNLPAGVTEEQVNAIAHQLTCDGCQGARLDECSTDSCVQQRQDIADRLGRGQSNLDIIDAYVVRYGWDVVVDAKIGQDGYREGVTLDDVNRVARQMYCDVCEGIPLDQCESITCEDWRKEIGRLLGVGYTDGQIIDRFTERYGGDVAAIPRNKSDRQLTFAVPAIIVALIGVIGGYQVIRLRRRGHQAGQVVQRTALPRSERPVPDDIDPQLIERLSDRSKRYL